MKLTTTLAISAAALLACTAQAQTTTTITPILDNSNGVVVLEGFATNTVTLTPAPSTNGTWALIKDFANELSGLTNISVTPYGTYASSHPKGQSQIGGGIFVAYNVNNYVGAGLGVDYMGGDFSALSGTVTLKLPQTYTLGAFTVEITPFALLSVGTPISGDGGVTTRTGGGAYIAFGHWLGGRFVAGALVANVTGAGGYSGTQTSIFAGWKKGF